MKTFTSALLMCVLAVSGMRTCLGDVSGEQAQMACCRTMQDCENGLTPSECCIAEQTSHQSALTTGKADIALPVVAVLPIAASSFVPPQPITSGIDPVDDYAPHSPPYLRYAALLI